MTKFFNMFRSLFDANMSGNLLLARFYLLVSYPKPCRRFPVLIRNEAKPRYVVVNTTQEIGGRASGNCRANRNEPATNFHSYLRQIET
jgi:hypothetical protein